MSDRLTELMSIHADGTGIHWSEERRWHCRCGEQLHHDAYPEARAAYADHLALVVRRHIREAQLPWTSGLEARNTGMAMAQARADEVASGGWLPGVDDVPEAAREGWDR